jgi:hypothetical protein
MQLFLHLLFYLHLFKFMYIRIEFYSGCISYFLQGENTQCLKLSHPQVGIYSIYFGCFINIYFKLAFKHNKNFLSLSILIKFKAYMKIYNLSEMQLR